MPYIERIINAWKMDSTCIRNKTGYNHYLAWSDVEVGVDTVCTPASASSSLSLASTSAAVTACFAFFFFFFFFFACCGTKLIEGASVLEAADTVADGFDDTFCLIVEDKEEDDDDDDDACVGSSTLKSNRNSPPAFTANDEVFRDTFGVVALVDGFIPKGL